MYNCYKTATIICYYNHTSGKIRGHKALDFWENGQPVRTEARNYSTELFARKAEKILAREDPEKVLLKGHHSLNPCCNLR